MSILKKLLLGFLFILCVSVVLIIVYVQLDHRLGCLCLSQSKSDASLRLIPKNSTGMILTRPSQYIWCVNHYGPNNQLKDFVKCCIIAMINNYTLIIPPLFPHYGDEIRGIQWFDHFYDLKQLSSIINFVTLDHFLPQTRDKKQMTMDCYMQQIDLVQGRTWYSKNTLISIQNYYKINFHFHRYINLSRHFNMSDLVHRGRNCSSIFLHIHYTTFGQFFSSPNWHTRSIFEHLHRNPIIQRMTSELIKFLPQLVVNRNHTQKQLTTLAVVHMRLGDFTVMSVSKYIEQILYLMKHNVRFTHLHIMCPYLNATDIENLSKNLPIAFTTTQQLLPHVRFVLDGYLFDVLEQEIAYQAPIFLASPWTTYSATVLMQKVHQQKGIVYLLSSKGKTPPLLLTKKNVRYFQ